MIRLLMQQMNVSGCENQMRNALKNLILESGLEPVEDETGCVYAMKKTDESAKTLLITVPMDVPGLIALYTEENEAYLSPTGTFPFDLSDEIQLLDEDGEANCAQKISKEQNEYLVKKTNVLLGDVFRFDTKIAIEDGKIYGYFASKYALLNTLVSLLSGKYGMNVIFLFTASHSTRAVKEKNVIRRLSPDFMIYLGAIEDKDTTPILLLKDGKAFSDAEMTEDILERCSKENIFLKEVVSSKAVTKAENVVMSEGKPFLSLALPYLAKDGFEEISDAALKLFLQAITCFLQKK